MADGEEDVAIDLQDLEARDDGSASEEQHIIHGYAESNNDDNGGRVSPMILYTAPTVWSLARGAAINLILPFVNGLMLGFGELLAHEAAFRLGWSGTKVCDFVF